MMKYKIVFNSEAEAELISIFDYIFVELENPIGARKTIDGILRKCHNLSLFPNSMSVRFEIKDFKIRFVHYKKYTIVYSVNDKKREVMIHNVVYSYKNIKEMYN